MTHHLIASATSWPDAAIAIAGVALVGAVAVVVVWQALATWRTRMTAAGDQPYRKLAEKTARHLEELNERMLDVALRLGAGEREEDGR
jgi:hypothetical protein